MRDDKRIVYDTILLMQTIRRIRKVVPVHCTTLMLKKALNAFEEAKTEPALRDLVSAGVVRTGRTINSEYYRVRMTDKTEKEMNEHFEIAIKTFLEEKAQTDPRLAGRLKLESKSMQDCCKYIIQQVRKKAKEMYAACTDAEVYGLALHYWDEDDIKLESATPNCDVVTPKKLTAEEKKKAEELKEQRRREDEERKQASREEAEKKRAESLRQKKEAELKEKKLKMQQEGLLFLFDEEE